MKRSKILRDKLRSELKRLGVDRATIGDDGFIVGLPLNWPDGFASVVFGAESILQAYGPAAAILDHLNLLKPGSSIHEVKISLGFDPEIYLAHKDAGHIIPVAEQWAAYWSWDSDEVEAGYAVVRLQTNSGIWYSFAPIDGQGMQGRSYHNYSQWTRTRQSAFDTIESVARQEREGMPRGPMIGQWRIDQMRSQQYEEAGEHNDGDGTASGVDEESTRQG